MGQPFRRLITGRSHSTLQTFVPRYGRDPYSGGHPTAARIRAPGGPARREPYRAKAYARAAESLGTLTVPLTQIVREGRLREISGVGEAIADIIARLHQTGTHPGLESMRKEILAGVLEMLSIPGLRPEKVLKLYKELGITSLAALEEAARANRLKAVKGLGEGVKARAA
jgi:DNA polymerase/3'-5' exonuclease PolX